MRARYVVGGLAIVIAVVVWAVDMTAFQPEVERFTIAENNSYWARELRHAAMVLALAGIVLIAEGRILASVTGLGLTAAWVTADVFLDRADIDAIGAGLAAITIAAIYAIVAVYLTRAGIVRPNNQSGLFFWAIVLLQTTFIQFLQSPAEIVPQHVSLSSAVMCAAFIITGCMLAAEASGTVRFGRTAACALALCLIVGAGILYRSRYGEPNDTFALFAFAPMILIIGAMVSLADRWPGQGKARIGLGFVMLVVAPVLTIVCFLGTLFLGMHLGAPLTAAAGNPPVNAADEDYLFTLGALVCGIAVGFQLLALTRTPDERLGLQVAPKLVDDSVGVS